MRDAAVGSVILLASAAAGAASAEPVLSIDGECPGLITVSWEGATPGVWGALALGLELGETIVVGPCSGTRMQIVRLVWVSYGQTGLDGRGEAVGTVPPQACGGYFQMIVNDARPCTTSNVVQIPE